MSLELCPKAWLLCHDGWAIRNHEPTENALNEHDLDIGDDLEITKTTRRDSGGGTWVIGKLHGHRFDALVFPEHAERPDYELGENGLPRIVAESLGRLAGGPVAGLLLPIRGHPNHAEPRFGGNSKTPSGNGSGQKRAWGRRSPRLTCCRTVGTRHP